jgi:hypothetical protein
MRRFRFIQIAAVTVLFSTSVIAQQNSNEVIYIKSARFATPLIEKWASEYEKVNPHIQLKAADKQTAEENINLSLVTSSLSEDALNSNQGVAYVGRYALLPVANAENPLLDELNRKRVNAKHLKELFFEKDILGEEPESSKKKKYDVTVYSGNKATSGSGTFASHFGCSVASIKGKKISGDDIFLVDAVGKDNTGIAFNNLSYLYNIDNRLLKDKLALIPLNVNKEHREILDQGNIDKTLTLLEREKIDLIPVEKIGFIYESDNPEVGKFLKWVLSEGQKYNHEYGFLNLEKELLAAQLKRVEGIHLTFLKAEQAEVKEKDYQLPRK